MPATRITHRVLARRDTGRAPAQRDDVQGTPCPECGTSIRLLRSGTLASHSAGGYPVNQGRGFLPCPGSGSESGTPRPRTPAEVTVVEARARGLVTRRDVAERYGISESGVAKWVRQSDYPRPVGRARAANGAWALMWDAEKVAEWRERRLAAPRKRGRRDAPPPMRLVLRRPGTAAAALGLAPRGKQTRARA